MAAAGNARHRARDPETGTDGGNEPSTHSSGELEEHAEPDGASWERTAAEPDGGSTTSIPSGPATPATPATPPFAGELPVENTINESERVTDDEHSHAEEGAHTAGDDRTVPSDTAGIAESRPARTKVTLVPPADPAAEPPEEGAAGDDRVYASPPPEADGLGKFNLGTVPASVTPPRSWRTAGVFATASSGGVAVALLIAGTYLVGQPTDHLADDGWPGLRGAQPELHYDGPPERTTEEPEAPAATDEQHTPTSSQPRMERISDLAAARTSPTSDTGSADNGSGPRETSPDGRTDTAEPGESSSSATSATTTQPPQKPSPEPAPRETEPAPMFAFSPDAETMGDRSETFLNQITENPEKAHEQTGGELHEEGAEGIAARYSEIAYFEIEHIQIDPGNRTTVNTVTVTWKDGSSTEQQRTLRFEEGDKITHD